MKKSSQGFTLIELIVVITILGILAAVALPRFIAAQKDARIAKANAIFGSIRAAASLARARCELDLASNPVGTCTAVGGTALMDGVNVSMINRFPTANAGGIVTAAQVSANDGLTISAGGAAAGSVITFDMVGAAVPANCRVSYTAPAAGFAPTITISATVAGC